MIVGILLAAGRGRRFDPSGVRDKLLERIDGIPVAKRSYRTLAERCERIVAVVRPDARQVSRLLASLGAQVTVVPDADRGMGHSLAAGAAAVRALGPAAGSAIAVLPADLPWLKPTTLAALVAAFDRTDPTAIAVPAWQGRRGHPVVFGVGHLDALAALSGNRGARAIVDAFSPTIVQVEDDGILRDIDILEDLSRG
jgi:molybdenum cofactor cytidylyltransferase